MNTSSPHNLLSRRRVLVGLGTAPLFWTRRSWASPPVKTLDKLLAAVSPLEADGFDPRTAIAAIGALQPLGKKAGVDALRRAAEHDRADGSPSGLFAVIRALFEVPSISAKLPGKRNDLQTVLRPGFLRPPALGAPVPAAPADLTQVPRFPLVLLGDVPLSVVSGYILGGHPEPLTMHLDALAKEGVWRKKPLAPKSAGEVRYLLTHWGLFGKEVAQRVEGQLARLSKT